MQVLEKKTTLIRLVLFSLLVVVAVTGITFKKQVAYGTDSSKGELGKQVYQKYCVICHGAKGDGKGLIGIIHRVEKSGLVWATFPRDFTVGVFKFRSTPTGFLPTDDDLMKVIESGILRSGMPSHIDVSLEERKAVLEYIKSFSMRWEEEDQGDSLQAKAPSWLGNPDSVAKGKQVYDQMKCWECHGQEGKGNGPKANDLKDDWGDKILPFDFTSGTLKRGSAPENIYLTYTTGLDGTGMPSFADSLSEEDRWHLASYTLKLMGRLK